MARVTFWLRGSYAPAQPTQYRYSNSFFSAAKGTSRPLRPRDPVVLGQPPRVPGVAHLPQRRLHGVGDLRRRHVPPADVDDHVDVLDHHRTRLHAGAAGGARPDLSRAEDLADEIGDDPFPGGLVHVRRRRNEAPVEVQTQLVLRLQDHVPGGQGHLRRECRAFVLAPAALCAPVRGEELLPGEIGDRGDAGILLLLDVRDRLKRPLRAGGPQEDARRSRPHVDHLREGEGGEEPEGDQQVEPPERPVDDEDLLERHPSEEERGKRVADVGDRGDDRVCRRDAGRLDQEPRDADGADEQKLQRVVVLFRETRGPEDDPADKRPEDAEEQHRAERFREELEDDVEVSVEDPEPEVELHGDEAGYDEKDDEGGEDAQVDEPAELPAQHPLLPEGEADDIPQAAPEIVEPVLPLRPPEAVRFHPPVHPPGDHQQDHPEQGVHDDGRRMREVPQYLSSDRLHLVSSPRVVGSPLLTRKAGRRSREILAQTGPGNSIYLMLGDQRTRGGRWRKPPSRARSSSSRTA